MNEESIFAAAIEKRSASERESFLNQACRGNSSLQARLAGMLKAHDQPDSFLDAPATGEFQSERMSALANTALATDHKIGSLIGPYKLLEQIGEGGMGLVYMAEQQQPVRRLVALKIIKPGMDSKQVIARFEAERQALAMMDHPNIARIYDAGTVEGSRHTVCAASENDGTRSVPTTLGRPYFVMELVRGLPINEFCDTKRLAVREQRMSPR